MDSSYGYRTWRPCSHHHHFQDHCSHHHHHHHQHHHHHHLHHHLRFLSPHHQHQHHHNHFLPNCPLHSFQSRPNTHSHLCPRFASRPPFLQNPELTAPGSFSLSLNFQVSDSNDNAAADADTQMIPEGNEEGLEAKEEEEYVFVLTDEWKELFAKSEAKRRLAKKQAKKKRKN